MSQPSGAGGVTPIPHCGFDDAGNISAQGSKRHAKPIGTAMLGQGKRQLLDAFFEHEILGGIA
jgi:hypothetical protein